MTDHFDLRIKITGLKDMALSVKFLPQKHEDLSLDPQQSCKSQEGSAHL